MTNKPEESETTRDTKSVGTKSMTDTLEWSMFEDL